MDIEIQIRNSDNYRKQSLYYWSAMYGEQNERIKERNEVIAMAEKILARASADELARAAYQQRRKWHLDRLSSEKYLLKQGNEQGKKEGQADTLLRLLRKKFGPLPGEMEEMIRNAGGAI